MIALFLDAEGRWDEALKLYEEADGTYAKRDDAQGQGRVWLNRSIAKLFTTGIDAAEADLTQVRLLLDRTGAAQLADYHAANSCLLAVLSNKPQWYEQSRQRLRSEEPWLVLSYRETAAVQNWFRDKPDDALREMNDLGDEFDQLNDAWGSIDNRINAGFLLLGIGRHDEAATKFSTARDESKMKRYTLGAALAAEGMRRLDRSREEFASDLEFYQKYLSHLFEQCPSPFSPCYLLLVP